ncbi:hypothetical protein D9M68_1003010 [compost metagenome]
MRHAGPSITGMISAVRGGGAVITGAETATELSFPSVPLSVDFSTWVAERERR